MTEERLTALYRQYGAVIYAKHVRLLGDRDKAEAVTQAEFVRAARHLQRASDVTAALAWLEQHDVGHPPRHATPKAAAEGHLVASTLDKLAAGALDAETTRQAQQHLDACSACRADRDANTFARDVFLREVVPRTLPGLVEREARRERESKAASERAALWRKVFGGILLPAVVALIVLAIVISGQGSGS